VLQGDRVVVFGGATTHQCPIDTDRMDVAFETLPGYARNTNQKLSDLAHALVTGMLSAESHGTP
jgi:hypothetical protein